MYNTCNIHLFIHRHIHILMAEPALPSYQLLIRKAQCFPSSVLTVTLSSSVHTSSNRSNFQVPYLAQGLDSRSLLYHLSHSHRMLPAFLLQCRSLSRHQCVCVLHSVDNRHDLKCVIVVLHNHYRHTQTKKISTQEVFFIQTFNSALVFLLLRLIG